MTIKHLEASNYAENLGELDRTWNGWKLRRGQLYDPLSSAVIGFRPEEIRALPIQLQRIAALELDVRQLKTLSHVQQAPERRSRQLTSLSRPAQNMTPERRSGLDRRVFWRGTAPVSGRIDPALVRADPARHKRSL